MVEVLNLRLWEYRVGEEGESADEGGVGWGDRLLCGDLLLNNKFSTGGFISGWFFFAS